MHRFILELMFTFITLKTFTSSLELVNETTYLCNVFFLFLLVKHSATSCTFNLKTLCIIGCSISALQIFVVVNCYLARRPLFFTVINAFVVVGNFPIVISSSMTIFKHPFPSYTPQYFIFPDTNTLYRPY